MGIFFEYLRFFIDKKKCCIYKVFQIIKADIAQLVELLICNQWVGSSSLSVGTIKNPPFAEDFFVALQQKCAIMISDNLL